MYHEVTYEEQRRQRTARIRVAVGAAVAGAAIWLALGFAQAQAREQGVASVRDAVLRAAMQCCAVEGSYPTTIDVLEERYGLVVNKRDYHISYEWLGDNIVPSVVVSIP